jgi:hypothetical protein
MFGHWLQDAKKKDLQELDELMMGGAAKQLVKLFNKEPVPVHLFLIFTPGAIDFVGGYCFYQFLKNNSAAEESSLIQTQLGKLHLSEQNGEAIHEMMFQRNEIKYPAYWKQVVSYF